MALFHLSPFDTPQVEANRDPSPILLFSYLSFKIPPVDLNTRPFLFPFPPPAGEFVGFYFLHVIRVSPPPLFPVFLFPCTHFCPPPLRSFPLPARDGVGHTIIVIVPFLAGIARFFPPFSCSHFLRYRQSTAFRSLPPPPSPLWCKVLSKRTSGENIK